MAHLTGGGVPENLPRILPEGCRAVVRRGSWPVLPIFRLLVERGRIAPEEALRVFNLGIGYLVVVRAADQAAASDLLRGQGTDPLEIGRIEAGERGVSWTD
jgi:phosphoribosylformylglycinamidine cyclo-ligase